MTIIMIIHYSIIIDVVSHYSKRLLNLVLVLQMRRLLSWRNLEIYFYIVMLLKLEVIEDKLDVMSMYL